MAGPSEAKTAEGREKAGVGLRLHHLRPAPGCAHRAHPGGPR